VSGAYACSCAVDIAGFAGGEAGLLGRQGVSRGGCSIKGCRLGRGEDGQGGQGEKWCEELHVEVFGRGRPDIGIRII
jgi:hypothetical protein